MKKLIRALILMALWASIGGLIVGILSLISTGGANARAVLPLVIGAIFIGGAGPLILLFVGAESLQDVSKRLTAEADAKQARVNPDSRGILNGAATTVSAQPYSTLVPVAKPRGHGLKVIANLLTVLLCIVLGGAGSAIWIFGTVERAKIAAMEYGPRMQGAVTGVWDSQQLELDLAAIEAELGDREIVRVIIFTDTLSINAVSTTDTEGIDSFQMVSGFISETSKRSRSVFDVPFDVTTVDAAVIHDVIARVKAESPDETISSVSLSMESLGLNLNVSTEGPYRRSDRDFNAITGVEKLQ